MIRGYILVTLLISTLVLARELESRDDTGTEDNVSTVDLEEANETHEVRTLPEKAAAKNSDPQPRFCKLVKKAGNCRAHLPRYFYDKNSGQCREFVYTGCRGNNNRFLTQDKCECMCVRN